MRLKADLTLLFVAVLWGSAFVAQRVAGTLGSIFLFNAARFLLAVLLLLPFCLRTRVLKRQIWWMCVAGAILFAASALQQAGMTSTTAGNAGFLTSLYVVLVPLVLLIGWREQPSALSVIAVVLAGLGAYLLSGAGKMAMGSGDLLELGGAVLWAMHVVLLGKYAFRYHPLAFSAGQMLVASGLSWITSLFMEPIIAAPSAQLVWSVVYTAVVSLGAGYTLQIWAQKHTPPTDAALILGLEAVFAASAGYVALGERLSSVQLLGCSLIVMAVALSQAGAWGRIPRLKQRGTAPLGKSPDVISDEQRTSSDSSGCRID